MTEVWSERTELLLGGDSLAALQRSHVAVVGLGGVGGVVAESLARAGIGKLTIVDSDRIAPSNRNRQIIALSSTEGEYKSETTERRLKDINPSLQINCVTRYLKRDEIVSLFEEIQPLDGVVDAIDTLSSKVELIAESLHRGIPVFSSMGAGGKLDPTLVRLSDISESYGCRLAFYTRKMLHRRGIREGFTVVYSPEPVQSGCFHTENPVMGKRSTIGTISYMPPIFGFLLSSAVIRTVVGLDPISRESAPAPPPARRRST